MKGMLVRVGADKSAGGGKWNGPVDPETLKYVYVPIPELRNLKPGMETPYSLITPSLKTFGTPIPGHLCDKFMHLDPDFDHLSYGDRGSKGARVSRLATDQDFIVFYGGFLPTRKSEAFKDRLIYALFGIYFIKEKVLAREVPKARRIANAHSRRILNSKDDDIVLFADPKLSGRFEELIPIGEYRDRAYRVTKEILAEWGGVSCNDGYLQRSNTPPFLNDPRAFLNWLGKRRPNLVHNNWRSK